MLTNQFIVILNILKIMRYESILHIIDQTGQLVTSLVTTRLMYDNLVRGLRNDEMIPKITAYRIRVGESNFGLIMANYRPVSEKHNVFKKL